MSKINIDDPITRGIRDYIDNRKGPATLTMVFPELPQEIANSLAEEVEMLIENKYNVLVFVDEGIEEA